MFLFWEFDLKHKEGNQSGIIQIIYNFLLFISFFVHVCVCTHIHTQVCPHMPAHYLTLWRSQDNLQESVLSFYDVRPRDRIQVICLCGKFLYPLSSLAVPQSNSR